ncbi:DUF4188 domain-containing protein [Rhodococcus sp. NPDC058521]|uniref:DUF4188 domain-containing protein n=1 Tax=Rhodococcus sp. NPDC058521 TaxID=3346536 RepID=UPI00364C73B6
MQRHTHSHDGQLVVFLIGMTVNRWWRPDLWLPALVAMPRMLRELSREPEYGFLGYRMTFTGLHPTVIQYWNSLDKLYAYASDRTAEHRPAWAAFNRRAAKTPGAVGVWHETYVVDRAESVYVDTPEIGLARFTTRVPVSKGTNHARARIERSELRTEN